MGWIPNNTNRSYSGLLIFALIPAKGSFDATLDRAPTEAPKKLACISQRTVGARAHSAEGNKNVWEDKAQYTYQKARERPERGSGSGALRVQV